MKKLICSILTVCLFSNIQAAVVNWVAGTTGDWNVAANWDTNSIPVADDEVFIIDGNVTIPDGYDAFAIRIEMSNIGTLTIDLNASLTLDGAVNANAFESFGTLNCLGDLIIDHVTYSGNDPELGNGILNKGNIIVTNNGRILLNDIAKSGIRNNNIVVTFENKGTIKVSSAFTGVIGIDCNNTNFLNTGNIEILASSLSGISANTGNFINKGSINIKSFGIIGMLITGTFTNKGSGNISIKNASIGVNVDNSGDFKNDAILFIENNSIGGLLNDALFTNETNGILTTKSCIIYGVNNTASIINKGSIDIEQVTDGDGITNLNTFVNKASGNIVIKEIAEDGIRNSPEGTFKNFGTIRFASVSINDNLGFIGVFNEGVFKNKVNSKLIINDTLEYGIQNFSPDALFVNAGLIDISPLSSTYTGILLTQGEFRNNSDGIINTHFTEHSGMEVLENAEFLNDGFATFEGSDGEGAIVSGAVINKGSFKCRALNDRGLLITPTGTFKNDSGSVKIEHNSNVGLENQGSFLNKVEGVVQVSLDSIDNSGDFRNKGILAVNYDGNHTNTGTMKNTGAIEDIQGSVLPIVNNKSVIATPLSGTVEVGVPYPDALNLGNKTNFVIDGWFPDPGSTLSAGTYDQATNVFTPDAVAIGRTDLFVQVTLTDGPLTEFLRVNVPDGVVDNGGGGSMIAGNDNNQVKNPRDPNNLIEGFSKITIAPNPARDYVNITLDSAIEEATQIVLYNILGQQEQSIAVSGLETGVFRFEFEKQMMTGLYLIEIQAKAGLVSKERILVTNQ